METKVRQATQADVIKLQGKLRVADEQECQAVAHISADEALQLSFDHSQLVWTGFIDDEPILMFGAGGVVPYGVPWLLATDRIIEVGHQVLRRSRQYIHQMLGLYSYLENFVDAKNLISIKWLKWCGFHVEHPVYYGMNEKLFHRFWMRRE